MTKYITMASLLLISCTLTEAETAARVSCHAAAIAQANADADASCPTDSGQSWTECEHATRIETALVTALEACK